MKTRYPNVTIAADRHGKLRARFRKAGYKAVYLKTLPHQPGFDAELKEAMSGQVSSPTKIIPGSVADLVTRYYRSGDFATKGTADTRARRRGLLEGFRAEYGNDLVADFGFEHIEAILLARTRKRKLDNGRTVGGMVAARNLRKELRRLFAYAKKLKWIVGNPVEDAERVGKAKLTGYHAWSEAEIAQYKAKHGYGTRARLALEIMLWTAQRRSDARLFGPQHIVRGKINFQAAKNGMDLWLPVAPDLRRAIDAMPSVGLKAFIVTAQGNPFSKDGFGNIIRDWCDEAGLPQCTAHGLRKAIARRMAQSAATQGEIKAVAGWRGDSEVTLYTASADQEHMAAAAIVKAVAIYSDEK